MGKGAGLIERGMYSKDLKTVYNLSNKNSAIGDRLYNIMVEIMI